MKNIIIYAADYTVFVDGYFGCARSTKVFGLTKPSKAQLLDLAKVFSKNAVDLVPSDGKGMSDVTLYHYDADGNIVGRDHFSPVFPKN